MLQSSVLVRHKFSDRVINPETETLIIGTFNPNAEKNSANFFYSRTKNYLWQLVPTAFGQADMRQATRVEKEDFARAYRVDFIDIISEVRVDSDRMSDFSDRYLDSRVTDSGWTDIVAATESLEHLRKACFTRKTFSDVPNIRRHVEMLKTYFHCLWMFDHSSTISFGAETD